MNKRHYVVYFENEVAITKTSREWARENQGHFKNFNFINNNEPTSNIIDHYLVDNLGFTLISDDEKFVCFKLTY